MFKVPIDDTRDLAAETIEVDDAFGWAWLRTSVQETGTASEVNETRAVFAEFGHEGQEHASVALTSTQARRYATALRRAADRLDGLS